MSFLLSGVTNQIFFILLVGFGITIITNIVRTITLRKGFKFDKMFVMWFCIHTFSFWFVGYLLSYVIIPNNILYYILMGTGIYLIGKIVTKLR